MSSTEYLSQLKSALSSARAAVARGNLQEEDESIRLTFKTRELLTTDRAGPDDFAQSMVNLAKADNLEQAALILTDPQAMATQVQLHLLQAIIGLEDLRLGD